MVRLETTQPWSHYQYIMQKLTIFVRENSGANRTGPHPQGGGEL